MYTLNLLFDGDSANEFSTPGINHAFMHRYCSAALRLQSKIDLAKTSTLELSVSWLGETEVQSLNRQFRHRDAPTNVLSFEAGLPALDTGEGQTMLVLGDIVLCPPVIHREATQLQKPLEEHWAHMLVHGTLHLSGYDHASDCQASEMEKLETAILVEAGMRDPYRMHNQMHSCQ